MRRGRKSSAQTPAPKSEKIYGSKKNPKDSARSSSSAKSIILSDEIINVLKDKQKEYNSKHKDKVSLATLKAVFRRGAGAYSKSHRPTISGGKPNSRTAWSYARVNKFLEKKAGKPVKKAYVQDDDLLEDGGVINHMAEGVNVISENNQDVVCVNCGWSWNTDDSDESDKYVCHKCGFDNSLYYSGGLMLKQPKTLIEIANIHNVALPKLEEQLKKGIKAEMEHTDLQEVAETIALHHIEEIPDYYDRLEVMEKSAKKIALPDSYSTYDGLKSVLQNQGYQLTPMQTIEKEFKDGGVVVGKRHSERDENGTGERFLIESTGQVVELEGGEGVLSKESMDSDKEFSFDGKKMRGREIASFLNHKYGGVEFAKGGEVGHVCGCKSTFYHGGELPSATLSSLKGGEAVVTVKTMESSDKYYFNGRSLTPRQILSHINQESGGKKFEEGGTIDFSENKFNNEREMTKMVYFTEKVLY